MFAMQQQAAAVMKMSSHCCFIRKPAVLPLLIMGILSMLIRLKHQLEGQGSIFQTSSDTEVLAHLNENEAGIN